MGKAEDWKFGSRVSSDRINRLTVIRDFDEVTSTILKEMEVAGYTVGWGNKPILQGCRRTELKIVVSCDTCDAFFNSPAGYRAQYYIAPNLGISQNASLILLLLPRLLDYTKTHPEPKMTLEEVKMSLLLPQAKIWIREVNDDVLFGDELTVDLFVDRWVTQAKIAWNESGDNEQRHKAGRGVLAPVDTILEIKGGWITPDGGERIDPEKIRRPEDISEYGFS
jgi:hypothetical protein